MRTLKALPIYLLAPTLLLAGCGKETGKAAEEAIGHSEPQVEATFQAAAAGPGKILFLQCSACHAITPDAPAKVGPNLHCVIGKQAGAREGFAYSAGFVAAAKNGLAWDRGTLSDFIASPGEIVPGNSMAFGGVADEEKRGAIIDHLADTCEEDND